MRIAMWSGPRNLSTAMMYSFGARGDFAVADEPFYAAYLAMTGVNHPMQAEILAAQPNGPVEAAAAISSAGPGNFPHFYLKLMTHHMVPGMPRDWMRDAVNVFLIRHPARVVASYAAKREGPTLTDLGFVQQAELFDHARGLGQTPVVIDSGDIRADPDRALRALCAAIGLDWMPDMLHWPAGGHAQDGAWAPHWYAAVRQSTGFAGAEGALPRSEPQYADLAAAALPYYERLRAVAL